ncbi:DUF6894 family protein [Methylobacterium nigriterrae]|uniref:DUF6894 family protein n=1 Tax=Methylobacterium nigriterrae TaxID=3127512 RepID=UPI003013A6CE
MPRYSIDLSSGSQYSKGIEIFEANDDEAAKLYVIRALPQMVEGFAEEPGQSTYVASVRDKRGITLFHVNLSLDCSWPD